MSSRSTPNWNLLSPRELDVVRLVALGLSNAEIAERLAISRGTVGNHVYSIFQKLELTSRRELAALAREAGLV